MATYTISTAVTIAGDAQKINTNDTVTVTSSGSLNGTGTAGVGIYSANTGGAHGGFDTLNISGSVRGGEYGFWDFGDAGVSAGNDTVTVNSGGSIFGGFDGVSLGAAILIQGGSNTISNAGQIVDNAGGYGIELSTGSNNITNTGSISSSGNRAVFVDGGSNTLNNSGTISSSASTAAVLFGGSHNAIVNSGTIDGYVGLGLGGGSDTITNSGTIAGAGAVGVAGLYVSGDSSTVTNTGTIKAVASGASAAGVAFGGDSNTLTNSGTISATATANGAGVGIAQGSGNVITNKASGTITGSDYGLGLGTGKSDVIVNRGAIKGGSTGIYLENVSDSHIKVLAGGSITGASNTGIYIDGGNSNHFVAKGTIAGSDYGLDLTGVNNVVKVGAHGSVVGTGSDAIEDDSGVGDHIFNAGTIKGGDYGIDIDGGTNVHVHNSGSIIGVADAGIDLDGLSNFITNKGLISGTSGVETDGGHNTLTNLSGGVIRAVADGSDDGVYFGNGNDMVMNGGKIVVAIHGSTDNAALYIDNGSNTIVNGSTGLISDYHGGQNGLDGAPANYAIYLEDGKNSVTNDGKIVGTVQLGTNSAANTYDGSDGRLKGTVIGGDGNDTILLGKGHSSAVGGTGADSISMGSGPQNVVYTSVVDSNITTYDSVDGFKAGTDSFSFALTGHALNGLDSVTVNSLSGVTDAAISAAVTGHLDPYGAVAVSVSSGLYAGDVFLVVDANGDAKFDDGGTIANQDYLVVLTHLSGTLSASDITTT